MCVCVSGVYVCVCVWCVLAEGSQLPLEDAGSGEEVGRRDLKRKALDMESYLAPKRRSMRVKSKQQEPTARFSGLQKYIPHCLR